METKEKLTESGTGWVILPGMLVLLFILVASFIGCIAAESPVFLALIIPSFVVWIVCMTGFYTLQPNESAVLTLFGAYKGTDKTTGFKWANPFIAKKKVSLRARNMNGEIIKVNDSRGNPIEIAAVVVWRVTNTARAVFDVDDFAHFMAVQSESALRHLAMAYSYDTFDGDDELTLRGSTDEVSDALQKEVEERVSQAGIQIIEARLSHLAYAPEIAGAMLQRQQAEAIVAARTRIVDGAVGMVEMALDLLSKSDRIKLDDDQRAAMVSNLLIVLCSHEDASPIVNAGTSTTSRHGQAAPPA